MVKTRTKLTKSRKKNKSIRKRFRQVGGASSPSESNVEQPGLRSPVSSPLGSQENTKELQDLAGVAAQGRSWVEGYRDRSARNKGNLEMIKQNIENCVEISNAYKLKHNELIEVYVNYLSALKENEKMAQEAAQNQQNSKRLTEMLKALDFSKILTGPQLGKLRQVQEKMKASWKATTEKNGANSAASIIAEIRNQFPNAGVQESDTYQQVIDRLKEFSTQPAPVSNLGGGKRKKKSFRKLKKYKKVFKKKSKKMKR